MGHSDMKYPEGLDANDRLSWIIGVTARNESFLFLQSCALLARLKGETRRFGRVRRSHKDVLEDCRKMVADHPHIDPELQTDARKAIKKAEKAVEHRNDLVHKIWIPRDVDTPRPKFTDWHSSFYGKRPVRLTFDDFADVSTQIARASLSLEALEWLLVSAMSRGIPGFEPRSESHDRDAPFLLRGKFQMTEEGGWVIDYETPIRS
jgi:hypothetical protein